MGCSYGKASALQELNQIINTISQENALLEKERDKLKSQHDDRQEEEKDSLQDLRIMHSDLESEIKELKDIMMDFIPQPELESTVIPVSVGIEKIIEMQKELEEKSLKIKELITKREEIKKDSEDLEAALSETEKQIAELEAEIESQEEALTEQENIEEKILIYEKEKNDLIKDIKDSEDRIKVLSEEVKKWENEEVKNTTDKHSYEALLSLSEDDMKRELVVVEKELKELSAKIEDLRDREEELQLGDEYINNLKERLASNSRGGNFKQLILESKEKIEVLRKEKKFVKKEVSRLKRMSNGGAEDTEAKFQALQNMLSRKEEVKERKVSDNILSDVEEVLRKVRNYPINLNK